VGREINAAAFAERIRQMDPELAVVELVSAMPKQGLCRPSDLGPLSASSPASSLRCRYRFTE
jgi:hypothetical protein